MIYAVAVAPVVIYSAILFFTLRRHAGNHVGGFLLCVLLGVFSGGLALMLEYSWNRYLTEVISEHYVYVFVESFLGVGLVEEAAKWLWLPLVIRHWQSFNKYTDGILFAGAVAAGFSLLEGILYALTKIDMTDVIIRGFTAVPVHFLFGMIQGFLFARFKLESDRFLWFSLLIPALLHGLYDFFILQPYADMLMVVSLLVLLGSLALSVWVCNVAMRADKIRE